MDAKNAPDTAPPLAKPVLGTRQLNPWDGWGVRLTRPIRPRRDQAVLVRAHRIPEPFLARPVWHGGALCVRAPLPPQEPVVAENESETAVIPLPKDAADSGDADGAGSWMKRADGDDTSSTTEDVARAGVHTPVKKMRGGRSSEEDGLPDLATSQVSRILDATAPACC